MIVWLAPYCMLSYHSLLFCNFIYQNLEHQRDLDFDGLTAQQLIFQRAGNSEFIPVGGCYAAEVGEGLFYSRGPTG